MSNSNLKLGQCFRIKVGELGHAYAQYVYFDKEYGPLFSLYDKIYLEQINMKDIISTTHRFLFIGGIPGAIKKGWWVQIDQLPVPLFKYPKFRFTFSREPGVYVDWKIWDGKSLNFIGKLSANLRSLEFLCAWSPQALEKRLLTGICFADQLS